MAPRPGCSRRPTWSRPGRDLDPAALAALTGRARPGQAAEPDREAGQRGHVLRRADGAIDEAGERVEVEQAQPPEAGIDRVGDPDRQPRAGVVPAGVEVGDRAGGDDLRGKVRARPGGRGRRAKTSAEGSGESVGEDVRRRRCDEAGEPSGSSDSSGPWNGWMTRFPVAGPAVQSVAADADRPLPGDDREPGRIDRRLPVGVDQRDLGSGRRDRAGTSAAGAPATTGVASAGSGCASGEGRDVDRRRDLEASAPTGGLSPGSPTRLRAQATPEQAATDPRGEDTGVVRRQRPEPAGRRRARRRCRDRPSRRPGGR